MRKFSIFLMALMMVMSATAANLTPIMDRGVKAEKPAQVAAFNPAARMEAVNNVSKSVSKKAAVAPAASASKSAQYAHVNLEGYNTEFAVAAEVGHVWATTDGGVVDVPFEDDWKVVNVATDGYGFPVVNSEIVSQATQGIQGQTNGKDVDGGNPAKTLQPFASGAALHFEATATGYLTVFFKGFSNKQYVVFEEGQAVGYEYAQLVNVSIPEVIGYVLEGDEEGFVTEPIMKVEEIVPTTPSGETFSSKNGVAVMRFPVHEGLNYLFGATGSKMPLLGAYFSTYQDEIGVAKLDGSDAMVLLEKKPFNLTFDNTNEPRFEYYDADGDWYIEWNDISGNYTLCLDYYASKENPFGHYTYANLYQKYSILFDNSSGSSVEVPYTDADFTISDKGNGAWSLSGYVVGDNGVTYNLNGYYEKPQPKTIDLTFDNTIDCLFKYYDSFGLWYLGWIDVTGNNIVYFAYIAPKEGKFGHYTIANLDLNNSYLINNNVQVNYVDADFTISDEGNGAWSLSGYVVGENGNTYNLNGYHEPKTIDVTFDNTTDCLFKYYDSFGLWYLGWIDVTGNNIVYLAYIATKEGKFGHYTIADLDLDNSHLIYNNVQVDYVDADFTIKDEGNGAWSLSGYVVGENGNTYNLNGYYEPKTLTFDNTTDCLFKYYAYDGVWYLRWKDVTGNNIVNLAYIAPKEGKFGHYTIANLDLNNSYLTNNNVRVNYVDADFTISDEGNGAWSLSGYVVCENGNTYNLSGYYEPKLPIDVELTDLNWAEYLFDEKYWYIDVLNSDYYFGLYLFSENGMFAGEYTGDNDWLYNCGINGLNGYESVTEYEIAIVSKAVAEPYEVPIAFELTGVVKTDKCNTYNLHFVVTGPIEPKEVVNANVECVDYEWPASEYPGVAGMFIFADTDVPSRAFEIAVAQPTGEFTVEDGIVKEYTGMVDYVTQTPYMVDNGTVTVSLDMEKNILTVVAAIVCADSIQYNFTSEIPVEFDSSYTITYTANDKLEETKEVWMPGLNINGFDAFVVGHTFSNGTGTITFSGEVTSIGETAFSECFGLTSIAIPNSVTSIGDWAFYECSNLTSVVIPNSVMSIGGGAFSGCSGLTSVAIPNSMTSIGWNAFSGCSGLTSITIPSSVTMIDWSAFSGCSGLTSITCEAVMPPYCEDWCFDGVDYTIPVYVPEESVAAYKTAKEWEMFTHIQAIFSGVPTGVAESAEKAQGSVRKVIVDGQLHIIRDDKTYTMQGVVVE